MYLKIKKLLDNAPYEYLKTLYFAFYLSGALYASEIFSDYTPNFALYQNKKPFWLRTGDFLWRKLFSNKGPGPSEQRASSSRLAPPLPSQVVAQKDLNLLFDILAGESTVKEKEIGIGIFETHQRNRSSQHSEIKKALIAPGGHLEKISVIKRYQNLLLVREESTSHPLHKIETLKLQARRKSVQNFIDCQDNYENDLRKKVFLRKYVYKKPF